MSRHTDGVQRRLRRLIDEMGKVQAGKSWSLVLPYEEELPEWITDQIAPQDTVYIRRAPAGFHDTCDDTALWSYGWCISNGVCYILMNDGSVQVRKVD